MSFFGAIDGLSEPQRGGVQAIGTVAGIYLGSLLQHKDDRSRAEAAEKVALAGLIGLAGGIRVLLSSAIDAGARSRFTAPTTVQAYNHAHMEYLANIDAQARNLLAQAQAATQAWLPFVPEGERYVRDLAGEPDGR